MRSFVGKPAIRAGNPRRSPRHSWRLKLTVCKTASLASHFGKICMNQSNGCSIDDRVGVTRQVPPRCGADRAGALPIQRWRAPTAPPPRCGSRRDRSGTAPGEHPRRGRAARQATDAPGRSRAGGIHRLDHLGTLERRVSQRGRPWCRRHPHGRGEGVFVGPPVGGQRARCSAGSIAAGAMLAGAARRPAPAQRAGRAGGASIEVPVAVPGASAAGPTPCGSGSLRSREGTASGAAATARAAALPALRGAVQRSPAHASGLICPSSVKPPGPPGRITQATPIGSG